VHLAEEEIWKIAKDRIAPSLAGPESPDRSRHEKWRIQLQMELAQHRAGKTQERAAQEGGDSGKDEEMAEELERLQEEVGALQEEQQAAAEQLAESEERERQARSDLEPSRAQADAALEELRQRIASCGTPGTRDSAQSLYETLDARLNELYRRIEAVQLLAAASPELEKIRTDRQKTEITSLIRNNRWGSSRYRESFGAAVAELSASDRLEIFREVRKTSPGRAASRNIVPLLAVGSWKQGDSLGAGIGSGSMGAGLVLMAAGMYSSPVYDPDLGSSGLVGITLGPLGWVGLGVFSAGYVFCIVEPFLHALRFNARLADALQVSNLAPQAKKAARKPKPEETGR
jgi:deoxyadenosine/deoxycytidine kinase